MSVERKHFVLVADEPLMMTQNEEAFFKDDGHEFEY